MNKNLILISLFFFSTAYAGEEEKPLQSCDPTEANNTDHIFTENLAAYNMLRMNRMPDAESTLKAIVDQVSTEPDFQRGSCAVQATGNLDQVDTVEAVYAIMHNRFLGLSHQKHTNSSQFATISPIKKVTDQRALNGVRQLHELTGAILVANTPQPEAGGQRSSLLEQASWARPGKCKDWCCTIS